MKNKKMAAAMLAATLTGALGMSGCATPEEAGSSSSAATHTASVPGAANATPIASDSGALLLLNDTLRAQLGAAYSDSWIEENSLHVAVTDESAAAVVSAAGAIPKLVTINAKQLEAALQAVTAWQATLPADLGGAIHKFIPDGNTSTLTLYVAAEHLDAVAQAAANDKPAGDVPLVIKESTGLATPL